MTRTVGTMEKFFMIDVSDPYIRLAAVVIDNAMKTVEKGSLLHHWKKRSQQRDRKCARDWLERCLPHYLDALTHDDTLYHYYLATAQQLVRSYDYGALTALRANHHVGRQHTQVAHPDS